MVSYLKTLDLVSKLEVQCQGKPFQLLLLSPQDSAEFAGLDQVVHHNVTFNPDVMCADGALALLCGDDAIDPQWAGCIE